MRTRTAVAAAAILTAALLARSAPAPAAPAPAAPVPAAAPPTEAAPAAHKLPLHDGFYLEADVSCGEAYTAAMLQIMGDRFESGRELCTIRSVSRHGNSFTVTDACQDTSMGGKTTGKLTVVIPDDRTVVFGAKEQSTRYRYCQIPSLPDSFKAAQETVPDTPPFQAAR